MDQAAFQNMANLDQLHWWYLGRRRVLSSVITRIMQGNARGDILEVGCGTGHNLEMLSQFGTVQATELDDAANIIASERLGRPVKNVKLPELKGISRRAFDLIACLDVLEHVEDDVASIRTIVSLLKEDGKIIVTVPAFQFLWSDHDVKLHHFRRYSKSKLLRIVDRAGGKVEMISYYNSLLFPIALIHRIIGRFRKTPSSDDQIPAFWLNRVFTKVFSSERHLVGNIPMPPGLSLLAVISSPSGAARK